MRIDGSINNHVWDEDMFALIQNVHIIQIELKNIKQLRLRKRNINNNTRISGIR